MIDGAWNHGKKADLEDYFYRAVAHACRPWTSPAADEGVMGVEACQAHMEAIGGRLVRAERVERLLLRMNSPLGRRRGRTADEIERRERIAVEASSAVPEDQLGFAVRVWRRSNPSVTSSIPTAVMGRATAPESKSCGMVRRHRGRGPKGAAASPRATPVLFCSVCGISSTALRHRPAGGARPSA